MKDINALRAIVFQFLREHPDFESWTLKKLKKSLADVAPEEVDKLTTEVLTTILSDFRLLSQTTHQENSNGTIYKKGKYSKSESELIVRLVLEYIQINGLEKADVCPGLREGNSKKRHRIWKEISIILPHRTQRSIYSHAYRQLMQHTRTGQWSEEERRTLESLVERYGRDWIQIGRMMEKHRGDCKDAFMRMQPRKLRGPFTAEENERILRAVVRYTSVTDEAQLSLSLSRGLAWSEIASELGCTRHARDYARHWPHLLFQRRGGTRFQRTTNKSKRLDALLLEALRDSEAEDESEVQWAELDRSLHISPGTARYHWIMMCKLCCKDETDFSGCLTELLEKYLSQLQQLLSGTEEREELEGEREREKREEREREEREELEREREKKKREEREESEGEREREEREEREELGREREREKREEEERERKSMCLSVMEPEETGIIEEERESEEEEERESVKVEIETETEKEKEREREMVMNIPEEMVYVLPLRKKKKKKKRKREREEEEEEGEREKKKKKRRKRERGEEEEREREKRKRKKTKKKKK
eukprot:CAMPEP_0182426828 /NCGR_PEP_ID=MMETSP1167-20130531/13343_1 /TAXON_ID=2988 /ORGANISM="Mallomonas Sp, Strain CCMP3275" /LENGTH=543 /DNA_ID=CAMNT_0024608543 /DNA_START=44 /DNA_END=1675 /DNA_ORIENTATION=+